MKKEIASLCLEFDPFFVLSLTIPCNWYLMLVEIQEARSEHCFILLQSNDCYCS